MATLNALLAALALGAGCRQAAAPPPPPAEDPSEPRQAQPKLRTMKLYLGAAELDTELALSLDQIRAGMMFRTNIAENEGMLFVFGVPHQAAFWMKNTRVPLSAAYITTDGLIAEIHDLHPHDTNSVAAATDRVQYVLEVAQGWFARHNVTTGAVVRTPRGTLPETFFPRR